MMIDPRGLKLFVIDVVFLVLTWLFFSLRGLVSIILVRRVSVDDVLMFACILIYTAHNTISIWGILYASQVGQTNLLEGESIALHSWYLCEALYAPLSALIRTSIGLFLLRIATVKWHRYMIYGTLAIVWALSIPFFFILVFQCNPPEHFYDQVLPNAESGTCLGSTFVPRATIAHSVISALMDFILALLPIAILWDVKLSKRTKAGVAALLGMGLFAGIALVVRIPYIKFTPPWSIHFLGQTADAALWSILEMSFGIIAGCAATLRPLASSLPSHRQSKYRRGSERPGGNNYNNNNQFRGSMANRRNTDGGMPGTLGGNRGNYYWPKPYHSSSSGTRTERVTSHPTSLSTADTFSSSKYPGSFYEMDSDPDFTREMRLRGYYPGYGYNNNNYPKHQTGNNAAGNVRNGAATTATPARSLKDGRGGGSREQNNPSSGATVPFSPPTSGVHVETSIEVRRDTQPSIDIPRNIIPSGGRIFPLQGERVVTINGPVKEGISTQTY